MHAKSESSDGAAVRTRIHIRKKINSDIWQTTSNSCTVTTSN